MKRTDELWYDHEVLRSKLALLEEYLPVRSYGLYTVTRLTDALAESLRSHVEREERMFAHLAPHGETELAGPIQHAHDDHDNERIRLAVLHGLLTRPEPVSDEQVTIQASYLIQDVRDHMAREEAELFPVIEMRETFEVQESNDTVEMLGLA